MIRIEWLISVAVVGGFPGPATKLASPTGMHAIIWEAPRPSDPDFTHHLLLEDRPSGRRTPLMPFVRNVHVEWSPSGQYVAITCRCGSDFSDVHVFDVAHPEKDLGVKEELQRRVGTLAVLRNHHAYVESAGWLDRTTLSIRLWGYGNENPKGFERRYAFAVNGGARLTPAKASAAKHQ